MRTALVELHHFKSEVCEVPDELELSAGDPLVISDEEGEDFGRFVSYIEDGDARSTVIRPATPLDIEHRAELDARTPKALELFCRLKDEFRLDMRVVGAHWRLDRKKICFYFASEERLDFRALHKAVSSALNLRVAIKQIGVRDHARLLGGLGPCGREVCCRQFMKELRPIALRMARQQNLFVEPAKISGLCGKLLCCLAFEDSAYHQWIEDMPRVGSQVMTEQGYATVVSVDHAKRRLTVRHENNAEECLALEEVSCHRGGV